MRLLHTSDWHLGRGLGGHSLAEAQQAALDSILEVAVEMRVDVVIVAGDIFDRTFPAVEDVRRLNGVLTRIHAAGIPIVVTAGNHDEGARLAAFRNLLDEDVHIVGEFGQVGSAVEFLDEHGPVIIYPLPYLDPDGARRALAPDPESLLGRSHEAVMSGAMKLISEDLTERRRIDPRTRSVVIAHAFVVTGSETAEELLHEQSESERDLNVGGVPSVPTGVFAGVDYVALGHLHGCRTLNPGARPVVHYSGSILRYSMSERAHEKSVSIVDIAPDGAVSIELIPIPQPRGMQGLSGELSALCSASHEQHAGDFVEITLTDDRLPDNYLAQLQHAFSHIVSVRRDVRSGDGFTLVDRLSISQVSPLETLANCYVDMAHQEPSESIKALLIEALESARVEV